MEITWFMLWWWCGEKGQLRLVFQKTILGNVCNLILLVCVDQTRKTICIGVDVVLQIYWCDGSNVYKESIPLLTSHRWEVGAGIRKCSLYFTPSKAVWENIFPWNVQNKNRCSQAHTHRYQAAQMCQFYYIVYYCVYPIDKETKTNNFL